MATTFLNRFSRRTFLAPATALFLCSGLAAQTATPAGQYTLPDPPPMSNNYLPGPDSIRQPGVPQGRVFNFDYTTSKVFPGTKRSISVYIPAEYDGTKPACVHVEMDGLGSDIPIVFDNLIAQKAMPVTIAIGVAPGTVDSTTPGANPRLDRSFEFDTMDDRLSHLLLDEILPEVERHTTPTGLPIHLSQNGNDRAIKGSSTGGIASFNVAWQRPDAFRRVYISIGTFVGMRGGQNFYVEVRKTEPKPIRVFYQDGVYDAWPGGPQMGDWWMAGQTMVRALEFAGYDIKHVYGVGAHHPAQMTALFPEAARWMWRDYPTPIRAGEPGNPRLQEILQPGEDWQTVAGGCTPGMQIATGPMGTIFYQPRSQPAPLAVDASTQCKPAAAETALAFGPDGQPVHSLPQGGLGIVTVEGTQQRAPLAPGLAIQAFIIRNSGQIYATAKAASGQTELWTITPDAKPRKLDGDIKGNGGLALTPDGEWLFVPQNSSRKGLSYRVLADSTVDMREPFYDFNVPAWADDSGAKGIAMDRDGKAYVATRMGVQIFDRNGRVIGILQMPNHEAAASIAFGGPAFDTLYVVSGSTVYKRKLKVIGIAPWAPPVKLAKGSAG